MVDILPNEVREDSRGVWTVWYQSEASLATEVPVFDREGVLVRHIDVGTDDVKHVQAHFPGGTLAEAKAYAASLNGAPIVEVQSKAPTRRRKA